MIFRGLSIPGADDRQNAALPFLSGNLFVVRQRHGASKVAQSSQLRS
jgi:hypothetical protein